ncbi:hypothetical protein TrVE_jg5923 [Triparma verrucosa]|uniref:Uncharacterized protein n=1 Tax=Triparma verrucosa TaxID=1606542 RepID=A0A9W7B927_9STRA|nr:hypothetical protein TrVE_jg5923 [Triparma verrucosa]
MVREYALASQPEFASATLGTIACSLFFQVVIVTSVYHKAGFLILFREIFYVLTFTKPGVDVHRVASNAKQLPLATITPKIELVALRGVELFAEVIPSTVIQAMAFAKGHNTNVAILSLLSSILTAAFISASISIEKDIDSENRWIGEDEEWFNEQVRVSIFEDFIEEEGAKKKLRTSIKLLRERREQKEEEGEQET